MPRPAVGPEPSCAAFTPEPSSDNGTCASCLQTDDGADKLGPVIWHDNQLFFTTNVAGCIADEEGDAGPSSCGAAYQALVTCKQTACSACLSPESSDPSESYSHLRGPGGEQRVRRASSRR